MGDFLVGEAERTSDWPGGPKLGLKDKQDVEEENGLNRVHTATKWSHLAPKI